MTELGGADISGVPSFALHGGTFDVQAAKTIGSHLQVSAFACSCCLTVALSLACVSRKSAGKLLAALPA